MKMMIVDDEPATLEYLMNVFEWEKMGITSINMEGDGGDALQILEGEHYDILISDIRMPNMDGLELVKRIRETDSIIKIIILSAYGEFEYAQKAIDYNVSGYLLKPIDEIELEKLIRRVISLSPSRPVGSDDESYKDESAPAENSLVARAKEFISSSYTTNVSLEDICNYVSVSKNYFSYLFKKETNENVWDYLTKVRIKKSKELLKNTEMKIYEISNEVGYSNTNYFIKLFKKLVGATPQDYRERVQGKRN